MALNRLLAKITPDRFPFLHRTTEREIIGTAGSITPSPYTSSKDAVIPSWIENFLPLSEDKLGAVVSYFGIAPTLPPVLIAKLAAEHVRSFHVIYDGQHSTLLLGESFWATLTELGWEIHDLFAGRQSVSAFTLKGRSYLHRYGYGIETYDTGVVPFDTLIPFVTSGVTISDMVSVISCISYMVATDGTSIYWSSPLNPAYWAPGGIGDDAGAGATKVLSVTGTIKFLRPSNDGFYIFTTHNIVYAKYTNNPENPWYFSEVKNSTGTYQFYNVVNDVNSGQIFVWSAAGFAIIQGDTCQYLFPDLTELLAGSMYEEYNPVTKKVDTTIGTQFSIAVYFLTGRYLCVSYGLTTEARKYLLVYDLLIKKWARLAIPHAGVIEYHDPANAGYRFYDWEATFDETAMTFEEMFPVESDNTTDAMTLVIVSGAGELTRLTAADVSTLQDPLFDTQGRTYSGVIFDEWTTTFAETLETFDSMLPGTVGYTYSVLDNVILFTDLTSTRNREIDLQEVTLFQEYPAFADNTEYATAATVITGYSDADPTLRPYALALDNGLEQTYTERVRGRRISLAIENTSSLQGVELATIAAGTRR